MNNHLGDTNISDTPRTDAKRGFHDLDTAVDAEFSEQLECELNAANQIAKKYEDRYFAALARIKRLEKDSDRLHWLLKRGLAWRGCYNGHWLEGEWLYSSQDAIETIDKAKEDKL